MNFFSPPELIVEKSSVWFSKKDNWYRCVTMGASCSANFALTWVIDGLYYKFSYSHESAPLYSANPRSKSFKTWRYNLTLSAHYEKDAEAIWQESIPIEIIRVKKAPAAKKSKTTITAPAKSSSKIELIPQANAAGIIESDSSDKSIVFILFMSVVLNIFLLRKKPTNNV